jgi:hypothetical protein
MAGERDSIRGIPVLGPDGAPVGRVRAVRQAGLVVGRAGLPELVIPLDAIAEVGSDVVVLRGPADRGAGVLRRQPGLDASPGPGPSDRGTPPPSGQVDPLAWPRLFMGRLARLADLAGRADVVGDRRRLLEHALRSTYRDCERMGLGPVARAILDTRAVSGAPGGPTPPIRSAGRTAETATGEGQGGGGDG